MKGCTGLLKERVKRGDLLLQGMIHDGRSGAVVEMFHECGFDTVVIDREHTFLDNETVLEHIRLARALDLPVMVRVPEPSYAWINCLLDQAPDGIFIPRIRTRAEVEDILNTLRYPPHGVRGLGGSTCPAGKWIGWPHVRDQVEYFQEKLVVGIQIETREAYENLDDILSVPGIDIAVIGLDDLTLGLGILGEWDSPQFQEVEQRIVEACQRHGVLAGVPGGDAQKIARHAEQGFKVFWCASDLVCMWLGVQQQYNAIATALGRPCGELRRPGTG
jgi:2-keto-3-deoxy-L-rhamnonate aldolase RhmA